MWYGFGQPVRAIFPLQPNPHAFFCLRPLFRLALINLIGLRSRSGRRCSSRFLWRHLRTWSPTSGTTKRFRSFRRAYFPLPSGRSAGIPPSPVSEIFNLFFPLLEDSRLACYASRRGDDRGTPSTSPRLTGPLYLWTGEECISSFRDSWTSRMAYSSGRPRRNGSCWQTSVNDRSRVEVFHDRQSSTIWKVGIPPYVAPIDSLPLCIDEPGQHHSTSRE